MKNKITILAFIFSATLINAQIVYPVLNIGVTKSTFTFRQPWCGGMNAPQFTQGDLNGDGISDLFAFDRNGDKAMVFINNGSQSDTAFDYRPLQDNTFPALSAHAQLRDYNHDSVPDLFTYTSGGNKLYKGIRSGNIVSFELVSPQLLRQDGTGYTSMFSKYEDFSPFVDVNFDGDMDFLTFGLESSVLYYENQTIELGLPFDSIRFANAVRCWGRFMEDAAFSSIHLISCKTDEGGVAQEDGGSRHAGGSTIYAFDDHNDKDIDVVIGDFGYDKLTHLENCGDSTYATMCTIDSVFPVCNIPSADIVFPTAFGVDADNDNITDILVAPNPTGGTPDVKNINHYRNTGDTSCAYQFVSDSFLVSQMLDFGTESKPAFFDYNSDGKLDIVVGNYGYFRPFQTYLSELALLENTGTNTNPEFNLRDLNYSNLAQYNLVGIHPAFGDLDGDGYKDLLVGELSGILHFFKSPPSPTVSFNSMTTPQFMNIDVGQFSVPFIFDINGDGLNDIVCGKRDGKLSYFWNYGSSTNPLFSMDSSNSSFGSVNVTLSGFTEGYSQPLVTSDSAGNKLLFVGSRRGTIFKYLIDPTKLRSGVFTQLDADVLNFHVGFNSTVAVADLNADGKTDYVSGNSRGGLMYFSEALLDSSVLLAVNEPVKPEHEIDFTVFPNPASSQITIRINGNQNTDLKSVALYDLFGRNFSLEPKPSGSNQWIISTQYLPQGFYALIINNVFGKARKILIQH